MRLFITAAGVAALALIGNADDKKGTTVEWAGMRSTTPAGWKEETPSSRLRQGQFKVPRAEGDKADAEVALFYSPGGGGVPANLKRQLAGFQPAEGKDKIEQKVTKIKIGPNEATMQELTGTYLKKPFPMAEKGTPIPGYKKLYVLFETKDGAVASLWLLGPEKTVAQNRKAFEEWVKNFK